jgi:hypothetical protein
VAGLRIPALAITNGAADPDWTEVPLSRWRFQRSPSQLLPLDPRTAKSVRRYVRLAPWSLLVNLVALAAWSALGFGGLSSSGNMAAIAVACIGILWSLAEQRGLPRHIPYRVRSGDLRIPEVPMEVARQWVAQNPGVTATDEPAPRPRSRRFYAIWSLVLLPTSVGLAVVLANNGREDFLLLWLLVPLLFVTAISMALKTQPPAKEGTGRTWPPGVA